MPKLRRGIRATLFALLCTAALPGAASAIMPEPESGGFVPSFTERQALAGAAVYTVHCAGCHGGNLKGAAGPALGGPQFRSKWLGEGRAFARLRGTIRATMPKLKPSSLSAAQYDDVIAYLLSRGGFASAAGQRAALHLPRAMAEVRQPTTHRPGDMEIANVAEADWLTYNRTLDGVRYSALDRIDARSAKDLTPVCMFQLGEVGAFEASPAIYDGLMYVTAPYNTYAIDDTTCAKVWSHAYPPDDTVPVTVNRGVAIYKGALYRVTPNGHLLSLDAKTGKLLWDTWLSDKRQGYWLSAAPIAYDDMVFVGEAGADWGANGHIYGLDAGTGKLRWTFNVIPSGKEFGAQTWKQGAERGGGSSWSTYTLQPQAGLLYVSVGNPAPDFNGAGRPGDNLFTNSVVALNYRTGKLSWYVQQVPHDVHDWDTAAAPIVYDIGGRHYIAVGTKGGWLYLYDRATRRLLAQLEVTTHANIDKPITISGVRHCPGLLGGVEWNGPAYSPKDRLLFVNSVDWCGNTSLAKDPAAAGVGDFGGLYVPDPVARASGWTKAFDAATGKPVWSRKSATPMLAAVTPTAGGVVFTGDLNGDFLVLDAKTGKTLYRFNTGGAVAGGVSTYLVGGRQYVAVTSGNNSRSTWQTTGSATVIVFSLHTR